MPICAICADELPEGARTCSTCGTSVAEGPLATASVVTPPTETTDLVLPMAHVPPGGRYCPSCGDVYSADHTDAFCACGVELIQAPDAPPVAEFAPPDAETSVTPSPDPQPSVSDPAVPEAGFAPPVPAMKPRAVRPPPGTPCLTLYGADRQPVQHFALTRDATVIGRLDAVAGIFPDIDLDEWLEAALVRKISRQHALIVRHRGSGSFALRPLTGNTGTQIETEMVPPMHDYPLQPGQRVILGGVVRLKFEIA